MTDFEKTLEARGIKPTAMRLLVVRTMMEAGRAMSLSDLEARLTTADKSTLFRTLTLFLNRHLVHTIEDGSGRTKYALCAEECRCGEDKHAGLEGLHTHFYCEKCHHTFCLHDLPIPAVELPEGFHLHSGNFVLKGLCPECAKRPCK